MTSSRRVAIALATFAIIPLALVGTLTASASHFRASGSSFSVSGNAATWTINSAWRAFDADAVFSDNVGSTLEVRQLTTTADVPDSGTNTGVELALTSYNSVSSSVADSATEVIEGDVSALSDGIYEVYTTNCCRIGGVENTPTDEFSNWATFTKTGSSYNLPPVASRLSLYEYVKPVGDTTIDFSAADPEGGAVTYSFVTDGDAPYFGATELPCSTFTAGVLTLGPSHCVAPDVFTDIYLQGTYWSVKILASDATGNSIALNSLLHVLQAPEPYIDYIEAVDNGLNAKFYIYDENEEPIDSSTIRCVSTTDPSDVVTGSGTTSPVTLYGFTAGSDYDCTVTSTNAAGSGTQAYTSNTGTFVLDGVAIVTDLTVGTKFAGTSLTLLGDNLTPESAYTLVQTSEPLTLVSGNATVAGAFTNTFAVPAAACVPGLHTLTLTGVGAGGGAAVDRVWYEIDANCVVLQFSRVGPFTVSIAAAAALAATGANLAPIVPIGGAALVLLGLGTVVLMRRRIRTV